MLKYWKALLCIRTWYTTTNRKLPFPCRVSFRTVYIVSYNLLQFCVHSWILANIIIRILRFGKGKIGTVTSEGWSSNISLKWACAMTSSLLDALADMFYSIGFATSLCHLFSILELYHIADGIEKARLLPRFIQVCSTAGASTREAARRL